jgi:alkylation response protein AidB-like acyl-CoA dehydrogenase
VAAILSGSIGQLQLNEDTARAIFKPGVGVAGVGSPGGRAVPVDGGYRVNGRWAYASGCLNSQWIFMNNVVFDGDVPRRGPMGPEFRMTIVPMSDVEVLDTWHVSGLRGTGSHDVTVHDLFVPEDRTSVVFRDGADERTAGGYRIPMFTLFGIALAPVALGAARRAIEELVAMAQAKTPAMSAVKMLEKPLVQYETGRAQGLLEAARAYLYEVVEELLDHAGRGEEIDMALRARVRSACVTSTELSAQAADIAYRVGGGAAIYEGSRLQRCFRDVHAVTQHFILASPNYEVTGRILLGLDAGTPVI